MEKNLQKIIPYLWYDGNAEEAANYYISLFKNSRIVDMMRNGANGPGPEGSILAITFELEGQRFVALNGGPQFNFTEAVSFLIECKTDEELDHFWNKLSAGGEEQPCGWVKDKFGLSWQVVPEGLDKMLTDPDPAKAQRVMDALMKMYKIDRKKLEQAHAGK